MPDFESKAPSTLWKLEPVPLKPWCLLAFAVILSGSCTFPNFVCIVVLGPGRVGASRPSPTATARL